MDNIIYENCKGETINLNSATIKSSFYDTRKFSFIEKDGYIIDEGKDFILKVVCVSRAVANQLCSILNKSSEPDRLDVHKRNYVGTDKLFVNGYYIACRWTGITRVSSDRAGGVKMELNFHAVNSLWFSETAQEINLGTAQTGAVDLREVQTADWAAIFTNTNPTVYSGETIVTWEMELSLINPYNYSYKRIIRGNIQPGEALNSVTFAYNGWLDSYNLTKNSTTYNRFSGVRNKPAITGDSYDYKWSFTGLYSPEFSCKLYIRAGSALVHF